MTESVKGSDLLSVRVLVTTGLYTALVTGGLSPIVALLGTFAFVYFLRR
jgi:hypothetical protein